MLAFSLLTVLIASAVGIRYSATSPVKKTPVKPILTVNDRASQTKIVLIGVSHGSSSSAELVEKTIQEINPSAVVLELCDDRFVSISLEAKLLPKENRTLIKMYKDGLDRIERRRKADGDVSGSRETSLLARLPNILQFAKAQGAIGGFFVLIGLFVTSLQKVASSSRGDEFVTAMTEAYKLKIPVRLGDAPQNRTLDSLKNVISLDTINPSEVVDGSKQLAFSAFGLIPRSSNIALSREIDQDLLSKSEWVNIPKVYVENESLLKSASPLLFLASFTSLLGFIPSTENVLPAASSAHSTTPAFLLQLAESLHIPTNAWAGSFLRQAGELMDAVAASLYSFEMSDEASVVLNILSLLLLVRLTKLIGTDRDAVIASSVQKVAREFPGRTIVVVIGMLHCNGVARWILSGQDPLANSKNTQL